MNSEQKEKTFLPAFLVSLLILFVNIYWYAIDIFDSIGWLTGFMQQTLGGLYRSGVFSNEYKTKFWALVFVTVAFLMKGGRFTDKSWTVISIFTAVSLAIFLFPLAWARASFIYMFTTVTGFVMYIFAVIYISKKINPHNEDLNDLNETFDQCTKIMENDDSINIPIVFQYKHRKRKGWINVVNPFRPSLVLGIPGSGKSFSVYNPFIEQMIKKGYTMFVYDYKFPDLTEEVYNQFMKNQDVYLKMYGKIPKFCVLNFDDPLYSHRCNPLDPRYITDPTDTAEIADLIMRNINPKSNNREDFFTLSAKAYIDSLI